MYDPTVYSTKSVKIRGIEYKIQAVLATKPAIDFEEPTFGQIKEIYVVESSVYFYIRELDILEYSEHYSAYVTAISLTQNMVKLTSIASYLPLSPYALTLYPGRLYLVPKFVIR